MGESAEITDRYRSLKALGIPEPTVSMHFLFLLKKSSHAENIAHSLSPSHVGQKSEQAELGSLLSSSEGRDQVWAALRSHWMFSGRICSLTHSGCGQNAVPCGMCLRSLFTSRLSVGLFFVPRLHLNSLSCGPVFQVSSGSSLFQSSFTFHSATS